MAFTAEELKEMILADAAIEKEFEMTADEYKAAGERDKEAKNDRRSNKERTIAANQRAYREAHKDEIAANQRAYREAHKDEIAANQRAYREAHKDEIRKYMREYQKRKRRA